MSLTSKQSKFVAAYLIDSNGTKAAIKAGYSPATAAVAGSRLLRHPKVAEALKRARAGDAQAAADAKAAQDIADAAKAANLTPLDYMLQVMNDTLADEERRDNMAKAAAPFMHPKMGEGGKKDQKSKAASAAGAGRFASPSGPRLAISNK